MPHFNILSRRLLQSPYQGAFRPCQVALTLLALLASGIAINCTSYADPPIFPGASNSFRALGVNAIFTFVALGDLNGDGETDAVVLHSNHLTNDFNNSSFMSTLLGEGDGTFGLRTDYLFPGLGNGTSVALGDLDGNGTLDAVVTPRVTEVLRVFLGVGDGTFAPYTDFPSIQFKSALKLGDVNNDGYLDAVATGNFKVAVHLGTGHGGFLNFREIPMNLPVDQNPHQLALGDLNNDGNIDIATSNQSQLFITPVGSISVLMGRGDGFFDSATHYDTQGKAPWNILLEDIDNNETLDVVFNNSNINSFSVFKGVGDGTFLSRTDIATPSRIFRLLLEDLDSNGTLDAVATYRRGSSSSFGVEVMFGVGDGSFGTPTDFNTGSGQRGFALADLNGDSRLDAVTLMTDVITISLGKGIGAFESLIDYPADDRFRSVTLGDLDNNGTLDVVGSNFNTPGLTVMLGAEDGSFPVAIDIPTEIFSFDVALGDMDNDGTLDAVASNYNGLQVLLGRGDGTFDFQTIVPAGAIASVELVDINSDGTMDVVMLQHKIQGSFWEITVLLGNGDGTFTPKPDISIQNVFSLNVGDLDGNGTLDIVLTGHVDIFPGGRRTPGEGYIKVLLGGGDGTFGDETVFLMEPIDDYPLNAALGDLNGDGILDAVTTTLKTVKTPSGGNTMAITVFLGTGDGSFGAATDYPIGTFSGPVHLLDVDGDGTLDAIMTNHQSKTIFVLIGSGNGAFAAPTYYKTAWQGGVFALGDVDRNGAPDVVTANTPSGISVLLSKLGDGVFNNPPNAFAQLVTTLLETEVQITLRGDDGEFVPSQRLTFILKSLPTNGTLSETSSGTAIFGGLPLTLSSSTLFYTPAPGFSGSDSFRFEVMDDGGINFGGSDLSPEAMVSIDVIDPAFLLGDINCDGLPTPGDAQAAFELFLGLSIPECIGNGDLCPVGGDGNVTPGDAQGIFNMFLGLPTPCG